MVLAKLRRRWSASPGTPSPSPRGGFSLHPTPLDSGLVSGQVYDDRGTLLPGASVTIVDRLNQAIGETKTDAYGGFVLSVAPGTHRLSLSAGGYRRFSTKVQVQVNQHSPLGSIGMQSDDSLQMPQPGRYRFDPYHTEIRFAAQHIGLSKIHGEFRRFDGVIDVAPRFEDSQIEVVMEAASIDTGVQMRDDHLRSADFLDVESHPRVLFRSERLTHVRADRWNVSGRLTLRGTTSPVELESVYLGQRQFQGPGFDGDLRVACDAKATLRREDYSVNWQATLAKGIAVVGPTISIELGVQAVME